MKPLSEVCLGQWNNPLNLEMIRISLQSGSNTQSLRWRFAVTVTDCIVLFDDMFMLL